MLRELNDLVELKAILKDVEDGYAALPLFKADRLEIITAVAGRMRAIQTYLAETFDIVGADAAKASHLLEKHDDAFVEILSTMARVPPGNGPASFRAADMDLASDYSIIVRALRKMAGDGWGVAHFDPDTKTFVFAKADSSFQRLASHNALRRQADRAAILRTGLERGIFLGAVPEDIHKSDIESLNPKYSRAAFSAAMTSLREGARDMADQNGLDMFGLAEVDRAPTITKLSRRSGVPEVEAAAILDDVTFSFPKKRLDGRLIEITPDRLVVFPQFIVMRGLDDTDYIRISKTRHKATYGAHQQRLTKLFEERVGAAFKKHAPAAENRGFNLPAGKGEIDRLLLDASEDAMLISEMKYVIESDDARVAFVESEVRAWVARRIEAARSDPSEAA